MGKGKDLCHGAAGPFPCSFFPAASREAPPEPLPSGLGGFPSPPRRGGLVLKAASGSPHAARGKHR